MNKREENTTFYATDSGSEIGKSLFTTEEKLESAGSGGSKIETAEGVEKEKFMREVIKEAEKKELDWKDAEETVARLRKEVDEDRMKYVSKDYETAGVLTKIRKLFGGVNMENRAVDTVADSYNKYRAKLTELFNYQLDDLKRKGLEKEDLKREMRDLIRYSAFYEKLKFYDTKTAAEAKAMGAKFWENFSRLSSRAVNNSKMKAMAAGDAYIEANTEATPAKSVIYEIPKDYSAAVKFNLSELTNNNPGDWIIMQNMNVEKAKDELRPDLKDRLFNLENKYINSIGSDVQPYEQESIKKWVERLAELAVKRRN